MLRVLKLTNIISIHAPRERSDNVITLYNEGYEISIHAPRERSDAYFSPPFKGCNVFQSTLLVRGATELEKFEKYVDENFNPRSS